METDTVAAATVDAAPTVMASVEKAPEETLILADVARDDAYMTMSLADAATLAAWR